MLPLVPPKVYTRTPKIGKWSWKTLFWYTNAFYCVLLTNFWIFFEIWKFMSSIFFSKIPKNIQKCFNFCKIEKNIIFVSKLRQNHPIDPNLAKVSLKTPWDSNSFRLNLHFQNFWHLLRQKYRVLWLKNKSGFF